MMLAHPRQQLDRDPDKPALIMADSGEAISYRDLVKRADRAAQLLLRIGLGQGDTLALFLENHIRYAELLWAAKNSGITYVCISSSASSDEVAYILENSDAGVLVTSTQLVKLAQQACAQLPGQPPKGLLLDGADAVFESYEEALAACPSKPLVGRCRGPSMLYSSGTTGRPKGVRTPLSDDPPEVPPPRLAMLQQHYGLGADSILINPGPFYHAAPGRFMISVQRLGGTVVAFKRFDAEKCLAAMQHYGVTHGVFVPTMFNRFLKLDASQRDQVDLRSLRCAIHLAAPCPIPLKQRMIDWWGPIIEEMYSGTEAVGHTLISSAEWLRHKGSVGRASGDCEIRIVGEDGENLPANQPGDIYMRNGRRFAYYKDEQKTQAAYRDGGWASLGDVGYLDKDGYLYLTDRKAHMIVSGGVNIYPQEIENVLITHPQVEDVAVFGIPNEDFGEEVKAVVQVAATSKDTQAMTQQSLLDWCKQHLSPIKCPRSVDYCDELPRNEAGKLLKRELREPYWASHASKII